VYVRLVSPPWPLGFDPRVDFAPGRGTVLREGEEGTFVCAGPVLVSQAYAAAEQLGDWGVIALPWLRGADGEWLAELAQGRIVCLDNHVLAGGQGEAVLSALPDEARARTTLIGVDRVPECGTNDEVLRAHGLDADSLVARVRAVTHA
jgi:transketolase